MLEIIDFIHKQKIGNIVLFCIFVIPYTIWIIWFISMNIIKLIEWLIYKANEYKVELEKIISNIRWFIWNFYTKSYQLFFFPFIIFCIKWEKFILYIDEVSITFGLVSIPLIIYIISQFRIVLFNLLEGSGRKMNVFADVMKRPNRNILKYVMMLFLMPILGIGLVLFIVFIPLIILGNYVEWVKWLIKKIKIKKNNKKTKKGNLFILYKYRTMAHWDNIQYKNDYLEGKQYFSDRKFLNDPAENISLNNRVANRDNEDSNDPLDDYKILSMTSDPGNFAMWTHYADDHKGICIGYIIDNEALKKENIKCERVIYSKFLPYIDDLVYPYDFKKDNILWKDIRKLIFYKLINWKYEEEWRLVKKLDEAKSLHIGEISHILCGYKCTQEIVDKIRNEVNIPVEQVTYERSDRKGIYLNVPGEDNDKYGTFFNDDWKYSIGDSGVEIQSYIGKLNNVVIPELINRKPVIAIGEHAFSDNIELNYVTIPDSVLKIESYAFKNCSCLNTVIIGKSVKTIGKDAFAFCFNLTSIELPESIYNIKNGAFRKCYQLKTVILPQRIKHIGFDVFDGCSDQLIISYK
jgi:hypothetical protein